MIDIGSVVAASGHGTKVDDGGELTWESVLGRAMEVLGLDGAAAKGDRKAADWKVAIAALQRERCGSTNRWLADRLTMGTTCGVSGCTAEMKRGGRNGAAKLFASLTAKIT